MSSRSLFLVACSFVAVAVILPPSASAAVTARYTYAPSKPLAETTTSFDASASICDQKPCSYTWRDDGSDGPGGDSTLLGTGSMLYETFHTAGGKVIRLTVTNRKGRASSTVKTISVSAAAPPPAPRCSNGQDDDGDGKIDYPNDPGCDSANDDTESPDPAPSSVQYVSPTAGATVGGVTPVRVRVPSGTNWIGVYACGGRSVGEDLAPEADGTFTVQWDTTICANGQANLDTWAFRNDGSNLGHTEIFVSVNNTAQPPPPPAPAECNPASVPAPVVGLGFTQRFGDCFDTLDRTTWCSHQWWEANPPIGSQTVANGELRLRRERSTGYADTTMTTEPCGQANPGATSTATSRPACGTRPSRATARRSGCSRPATPPTTTGPPSTLRAPRRACRPSSACRPSLMCSRVSARSSMAAHGPTTSSRARCTATRAAATAWRTSPGLCRRAPAST